MADLNSSLKEAAYVAVGFGVLGFQRAQVRRRELARQLREQRPGIEAQVEEAWAKMGNAVSDLGNQLRGMLKG